MGLHLEMKCMQLHIVDKEMGCLIKEMRTLLKEIRVPLGLFFFFFARDTSFSLLSLIWFYHCIPKIMSVPEHREIRC